MRRRYQEGSLKKVDGKWIAQWWEDGHRRKRTLGLFRRCQRLKARGELDAILAPINSRADAPSAAQNWGTFVNNTLPPLLSAEMETVFDRDDERRIVCAFILSPSTPKRTLGSFNRDELQTMLDEKAASGLSYSVVAHLRWDLRQILRMAVTEGHILRNPAELLFIPRDAKRPEHTSMNIEEVQKCFAVLEQRERLIVKFAVLAGLRPGEIFGLKWGHLSETHVDIRQRVYRGQIDSPKDFELDSEGSAIGRPDGRDSNSGESISLDTERRRLGVSFRDGKDAARTGQRLAAGIGPKLKAAGLGWVDFHVMRRTHSTLMNEIHDDPKLVADQLGHTRRRESERLYAGFCRETEDRGGCARECLFRVN